MAEQFRVTFAGRPRSEWRDEYALAMLDAIKLGLASRDRVENDWFIAVPVAIERRGKHDQAEPPYPLRRPQLRERWSPEDMATLRTIADDGETLLTAIAYLGRSRRAIERKARALGLQFAEAKPAAGRRPRRANATATAR